MIKYIKNYFEKKKALKKIVARVRPLWWFETYSFNCLEHLEENKTKIDPKDYFGKLEIFYKEYENGLGVGFGIEDEESVVMLTQNQIQERNLDYEALINISKKNLEHKAIFRETTIPRVYASALQNTCDSGLMLLKEEFLKLDVIVNPIVFFFSRNCIFVTGDADTESLIYCMKMMIDCVEDNTDSGFILESYKLLDNRWIKANIEGDHEVVRQYNISKVKEKAFDTNDFFETNCLIFPEIENYAVMPKLGVLSKDHECITYAVLVPAEITWLPKSSVVAFSGYHAPDKEMQIVDWNELFRICSSKMKKLDYHHEIWEFEGYPSDAEIDLMTKRTDII